MTNSSSDPLSQPLRDRRRQQTLREIQAVTLQLIDRHGFDAVSTEMIATEAGISKRTFFNYYLNKEAAALGPPLTFTPEALEAFAAARGTLVDDMAELLRVTLAAQTKRKDTIRAIAALLDKTPLLVATFRESMRQLNRQLTALLAPRLGPGHALTADILGEVVVVVLGRAFLQWGHDESMTLDAAVDLLRAELLAVGRALAA